MNSEKEEWYAIQVDSISELGDHLSQLMPVHMYEDFKRICINAHKDGLPDGTHPAVITQAFLIAAADELIRIWLSELVKSSQPEKKIEETYNEIMDRFNAAWRRRLREELIQTKKHHEKT